MKTEGKCFICGREFTYRTTSNACSDSSYFGGHICFECRDRGLGYFTHTLKEMVEAELKYNIRHYAKKVHQASLTLKGDWWKKDSALYKKLKIRNVRIVIE